MTFEEAIAFLEARIRWGMRPGTERIAALVEALDHPERSYPVVHISGTNGKFSVATIVTAILEHLGYSVGTYTSPHLESVRERIAVGREPLTEDEFAAVVEYLAPYVEAVEARTGDQATYFELLTLMAFEAFFDRAVHVAVVECGLGGEYDATNVADAAVAVVCNVSLDHVKQFGNDLRKAAWEKAGIVKHGTKVATGIDQPELLKILSDRARERGATPLVRLGLDVRVADRRPAIGGQVLTVEGLRGRYDDLFLSLFGSHQASNAALAIAACELFVDGPLDGEALSAALAGVRIPGRLEVCARHPLVVCDGGHNPEASDRVREALEEAFSYERITVVVGMLDDKLIEDVLAGWTTQADAWVVTAPTADRAADPGRLVRALEAGGVPSQSIEVAPSVGEGIDRARSSSGPDDLVLVFGSFTTVGEARVWLRSQGLLAHA